MQALIFGLFGGITVFSAFAVARQKNLLNASFLLLITFLGVATLLLLAQADFLAVTQLLIYVGGILTLILFGILITNKRDIRLLTSGIRNNIPAGILSITLFLVMIYVIYSGKDLFLSSTPIQANTELLGIGILGDYMIYFELVGFLLLAVLVGVLALASSVKHDN